VGRVDFTSATTEMLLGMLGGTSKQERAMIRTRVRDGMTVFAQDGSRHLGGRPPYGYLLADAGEHPNPKKRALGQRLHRLEPDPVTAPVVERIFTMFAAGRGLKEIATVLTAADIPSPSAHDPERNRHRDPRGWGHTAIRSILLNERYLGRAVWGKQARTDELFDLDDVAAGYVTRQRWTESNRWVYGPHDAHPALIDQALWDGAGCSPRPQEPVCPPRHEVATNDELALHPAGPPPLRDLRPQDAGQQVARHLAVPLPGYTDPGVARLPRPPSEVGLRPRA
jgi:hypothetical protein